MVRAWACEASSTVLVDQRTSQRSAELPCPRAILKLRHLNAQGELPDNAPVFHAGLMY